MSRLNNDKSFFSFLLLRINTPLLLYMYILLVSKRTCSEYKKQFIFTSTEGFFVVLFITIYTKIESTLLIATTS